MSASAVPIRLGCCIPATLLLFAMGTGSAASASEGQFAFEVHEIGRPGGDSFGQTSLVDVDHDGDVDFISGQSKGGSVYWFEQRAPAKWEEHLLGERARTDVGGVAFDVDGDGWVDQVSGSVWYRNPGKPRKTRFRRFENGAIPTHDNRVADVNGDGRRDLVSLSDEKGVYWYEIPDDPTTQWVEHRVMGKTEPPCHGGVAAGDLDGDGDVDLTRVDRWLENADGKGTTWEEHRVFDFGKVGPWGLQTRVAIVDVDGDGDPDLVQAEGDVRNGRVAWFENRGGAARWARHMIKAEGHGQDFHSLCVADFDGDGDPDVFTGGGPLTKGTHKWFIWENRSERPKSRWREHVVLKGYRTHEAVCGDVDGDGDVDVVTKPWDGDLHIFAENLRVDASDG